MTLHWVRVPSQLTQLKYCYRWNSTERELFYIFHQIARIDPFSHFQTSQNNWPHITQQLPFSPSQPFNLKCVDVSNCEILYPWLPKNCWWSSASNSRLFQVMVLLISWLIPVAERGGCWLCVLSLAFILAAIHWDFWLFLTQTKPGNKKWFQFFTKLFS